MKLLLERGADFTLKTNVSLLSSLAFGACRCQGPKPGGDEDAGHKEKFAGIAFMHLWGAQG